VPVEIDVLFDEGLEADLEAGWLERVAQQVLVYQRLDADVELGLVIVGQERIRQLNLSYLGRNEPTDVIAFALLPEGSKGGTAHFVLPPDGIKRLGEVIVSYPQAISQAEEHQHPVKREIALLVIHGVLHLLGYEHDEPERERRMRAREAEILNLLKVLGITGSPRRGGNTDLLLEEFMRGAASNGAEVKTIVLNNLKISPCQHCDACLEKGICKIKDAMQMIYQELEQADRIVLASPIQFMGVTAQMKAMIDRCQCLWARKYVLKIPPLGDGRERKGFFISVGGRKILNLFEPALAVVKTVFRTMDVAYAGELLFSGIDEKGAITKHPDALRRAFLAGQKLVEG
jgi:rRNA maturation RNase YbeY